MKILIGVFIFFWVSECIGPLIAFIKEPKTHSVGCSSKSFEAKKYKTHLKRDPVMCVSLVNQKLFE